VAKEFFCKVYNHLGYFALSQVYKEGAEAGNHGGTHATGII